MIVVTGSETKPQSRSVIEIRQDWTREAVALMHRDHKRLWQDWENLIAAIEGTCDRQVFRGCLEVLIAGACEHFRNEEWAMRVTGFDELAVHAEDHKKWLRDADDMLVNLDLALRPDDWPALATVFRYRIQRHEDRYDRALRQHIETIENRVRT